MFKITAWTPEFTDDGNWKTIPFKTKTPVKRFRLLDDDRVVGAYGYSSDWESELAFEPLDIYGPHYGFTEIQYLINRKWVTI
jgi:hypothetical protein